MNLVNRVRLSQTPPHPSPPQYLEFWHPDPFAAFVKGAEVDFNFFVVSDRR